MKRVPYNLKVHKNQLEKLCLVFIKHLDPDWLGIELELQAIKSPKRFLAKCLKEKWWVTKC